MNQKKSQDFFLKDLKNDSISGIKQITRNKAKRAKADTDSDNKTIKKKCIC